MSQYDKEPLVPKGGSGSPSLEKKEKKAAIQQIEITGPLKQLVALLNEKVGKGNWAFTGSFALHVWSVALLQQSLQRPIGDIDLLLLPDKRLLVSTILMEAKYLGPSELPGGLTRFKGQSSDQLAQVDLLAAGGKFGTLGGIVEVEGLPVASLESLKASKTNSKKVAEEELSECDEEEEAVVYGQWKREVIKAQGDLDLINKLMQSK